MAEQDFPRTLYPKAAKKKQNQERKYHRPWRVDYELAYEGGDLGCWSGYYRTYTGARIAAFWNQYFASYGGTAILHHKFEYGNAPGAKPLKIHRKN